MALLSGFDQLDTANNTFADWLLKTNNIIELIRGDTVSGATSVMTANSLPGGSMTFGNATLFGQFTSNTMVVLNNGLFDGSDDNEFGNTTPGFANGDFGGLRGGNWDPNTNNITADTLYVVSNTTFTPQSVEVYVNSTYGLIVENFIEARHDVRFVGSGSNTNPDLQWDDANTVLSFNDDIRATFGGSSNAEPWGGTSQMEMFYSGGRMYSNTDVQDVRSTANLNLITDRFELRSETGGEEMITANLNGEVVLFWNDVAKMTTNTYGITVHGDAILEDDLVIFDNNKILMGGSTTYDGTQDLTTYKFQMFTDGSDAFIKADDRDLYIEVNEGFELTNIGRGTHYMTANATGENEVALFAAGTERLSTIDSASDADNSPDGVEIYGEANTNTLRVQSDANFDGSTGLDSNNISWDASANTLYVRDDTPVVWGDGNDLTIKHDGSHSYITEANTGSLYIEATNLVARATDGSRYLEGIDGSHVIIYSPDDTAALLANNNQVHITDLANTNTLRVRSTSLFEDDINVEGSTGNPTLTWDKSANTLNFDDDNYITLGTSADLTMYHDSSNNVSYIKESGTGDFVVQANNMQIQDTDGLAYFCGFAGNGASLHFNGDQKLITTNTGIDIEGEANTDTLRVQSTALFEEDVFFDTASTNNAIHIDYSENRVVVADHIGMYFGVPHIECLHFFNDGVNAYIREEGSGNLEIQANNVLIEDTDTTVMIAAESGNGVKLYYNGSRKLLTTAIGIDVTGQVLGDSLQIDGNVDLGSLSTHSVSVNGRLDTNLISSNQSNVGSMALPWDWGYFNDINVANTATILNLEVGALEANGVAFTGTGDDVTTTAATVIDSFPIGQTQGFKYFVHGEDLADADSGYAVEINIIVTDNLDIFYTRYGEVENNMSDVVILPSVAANNTHIDLKATCGSASGTNIHRFKVLKIETRP
jgi:hypothetical protein